MSWLVSGLGLAALVTLAALRLAGHDPEVWHIDPAEGVAARNAYVAGSEGGAGPGAGGAATPAYDADPYVIAAALDRHALAQPRVVRIAGGPQELWTTYVQRSRVFGFPDYVSVRVVGAGEGRSRLAIFSRARFGMSDLGVNRARVENWLAAIEGYAA